VNDNKPDDKHNKQFAETLSKIDTARIPNHAYLHTQNSNSVAFPLAVGGSHSTTSAGWSDRSRAPSSRLGSGPSTLILPSQLEDR